MTRVEEPGSHEASRQCAFCGSAGPLSKEHVFGEWLGRLGLESELVTYRAGPLNRIPKNLGVGPMFGRTVRNVCAACNNGWMSRLEQGASRVLTPLVLGEPTDIDLVQHGVIAAWAMKTVLVAMLMSSQAERADGYGLNVSEYHKLYELRDLNRPLPASVFWIGGYDGQVRQAAAAATPFLIEVEGLVGPREPNGYTITIAVGKLVIHGVRFTTQWMDVDLDTRRGMSQIWPAVAPVSWPIGDVVGDDDLIPLIEGRDVRSSEPSLRFVPWKESVALPESKVSGAAVALPSVCGLHTIYYPRVLMEAARRGDPLAFVASCDCGQNYLIHLETESARFKAAGPAAEIESLYDALPGEEFIIEDDIAAFVCKRLNSKPWKAPSKAD